MQKKNFEHIEQIIYIIINIFKQQSKINNNKQMIKFNMNFVNKYFFARTRNFHKSYTHNLILKQYLAKRFTYSTNDLFDTMIKLKNTTVNVNDQRFKNLLLTVEKNLNQFQLEAKIKILWILVSLKVKQNDVENILIDINKQINNLNMKQLSILLWCLAKLKNKKVQKVLKIADKIKAIFQEIRQFSMQKKQQSSSQFDQIKINQNSDEIQVRMDLKQQEIEKKKEVHPMTCVLIIWSLSKLNLIDKQIFDIILKKTVLKNLQYFSNRQLIVLLDSCHRINYNRKNIIEKIYIQIRKNHETLEVESVLTLILLLRNISKMNKIESEFMIWLSQIILNKHDTLQKISPKFTAQILWSLLINKIHSKQLTQILLNNLIQRIDKANGIDCSMILFVLMQNKLKKNYPKQIKQLVRRLERIKKTIGTKTKQILVQLCSNPDFDSPNLKRYLLNQTKNN